MNLRTNTKNKLDPLAFVIYQVGNRHEKHIPKLKGKKMIGLEILLDQAKIGGKPKNRLSIHILLSMPIGRQLLWFLTD